VKQRRSTSSSAQYIGGLFSDGLIGKRHKKEGKEVREEKEAKTKEREPKDEDHYDTFIILGEGKKKRRSLSGNMFEIGKLSKSDAEKEKKAAVQFNLT
jgi:hypothetical protein